MSNPEQAIPDLKTITGTKRKGEPTYDELVEEIKRVRASLKDSRIQYNAVVKKVNTLLWLRVWGHIVAKSRKGSARIQ